MSKLKVKEHYDRIVDKYFSIVVSVAFEPCKLRTVYILNLGNDHTEFRCFLISLKTNLLFSTVLESGR